MLTPASKQVAESFRHKHQGQRLPMSQAEVYLLPDFLPPPAADGLLLALTQKVTWHQRKINMFGRQIDQPRLSAWYADAGKSYTYSGLTWHPEPWLPELTNLRLKLEKVTGAAFNSVLLNLYRHGQDSMGWHADDEPELGANPIIASISLGAERFFSFRHRHQKDQKLKLNLTAGSLLLMAGQTQQHWQHQVAKTTQNLLPRVNLTFRFVF